MCFGRSAMTALRSRALGGKSDSEPGIVFFASNSHTVAEMYNWQWNACLVVLPTLSRVLAGSTAE